MEMQTVNVDHVSGFLKRFVHISVFENAVPDFIRAHFLVKNALVFQRLFRIQHGFQRLVFHLNEFGCVLCKARGFGHNSSDRLTLVQRCGNRQRIIADFGARLCADFDERLGLRLDFTACDRAYDSRQGFGRGRVDADDPSMGIW